MSDITFNCPHCDGHIAAPCDGAGMQVPCPHCSQEILIPAQRIPAPPTLPPPLPPQHKPCPYCGEEILAIARKCKHCGEFLDGSPSTRSGNHEQIASQLRSEYDLLNTSRAHWNRLSFVWGIPGIVALIVYAVVSINDPASRISAISYIANTILLGVGFGYYAKYKGHHPAWALVGLFMCFGILIMACLKDKLKQRLDAIQAQLTAMGESVPPGRPLLG
jgi:hypothetical protein